MIRLEEKRNFQNIDDVFTARIAGSFHAGISELVWSDGGNLLMGLNNGVLTVSGVPEDAEEFQEFLSMISPEAIICSCDFPEPAGFKEIQSGVIMKAEAHGKYGHLEPDMDIRFKDYFELFSEAGLELEYEGFCMHMSRYMRSKSGFLEKSICHGNMVAAAAVSDVTDTAAILNAVAVREKYRRRGIASEILKRIEGKLGGRKVFLFREHNENEEFYLRNGYKNAGLWKVMSRQSVSV